MSLSATQPYFSSCYVGPALQPSIIKKISMICTGLNLYNHHKFNIDLPTDMQLDYQFHEKHCLYGHCTVPFTFRTKELVLKCYENPFHEAM